MLSSLLVSLSPPVDPWVQPPPPAFDCEHLAVAAREGLLGLTCRLPDPYAYEHPASRWRTVTLWDTSGWGPTPPSRALEVEGCEAPLAVRATVHQGHVALDHVCGGLGMEVTRLVLHEGRWLIASVWFYPLEVEVALERADAVFDQVRFRDLEVGR